MTILITAVALLISGAAYADYNLADNESRVTCYADDNQSWILNEKRTRITYTIEGETRGPRHIREVSTNERTYISYTTDEGTLTLSKKDTWQYADNGEVIEVECE